MVAQQPRMDQRSNAGGMSGWPANGLGWTEDRPTVDDSARSLRCCAEHVNRPRVPTLEGSPSPITGWGPFSKTN